MYEISDGVRVSHPGARAPTNETPAEMYAAHEKQKMTKYNHRVMQVEKGTFAPLCFSTTGWHGTPSYDVRQKVGKANDQN